MKLDDFAKLKKIMQLTTSDNDAEALSSIRMANAILKKTGLTWEEVFGRTVKVTEEVEAADEVETRVDPKAEAKKRAIREAFDVVLGSRISPDFESFIRSLQRQFNSRGYLSLAQESALMKSARKVREEARMG